MRSIVSFTARSLPGIGVAEKITVSPACRSTFGWSPCAIRRSAESGSPCDPVEITTILWSGKSSTSRTPTSIPSGISMCPSWRPMFTFLRIERPTSDTFRPSAAAGGGEPADEAALRELGELRDYRVGGGSDTGAVLAGDGSVLLPELPEHGSDRYRDAPEAAAVYDRLRLKSVMVVPIRARGRVLGALTLVTQQPYGRRYTSRDLHLAADLAGRAGLAVDNVRLYQVEHAAAATLQRSLLPAVPDVEGMQVAARYLVGVDGNQVGGDWYDALNLPDGSVGIAVGDVV